MIAGRSTETFTVIPGRADAGLIILCDHAANAFPPGYGTLGLPPEQLNRHIAYDIGAAEITRQLAGSLGVPAVMTHYSRLLIDPNRGDDDPTLIMRLSDGAIVPGNRHLDDAERAHRVARYYRPYHDAISQVVDACVASSSAPALLSIHSFTESWKGVSRPWHAGVLWDKDPRLAQPLLDALHADGDIIVGDNEPYTGKLRGDTMWQHGSERGLAHCIIEVRQDLIRDLPGQTAWAERLGRIMRGLLSRPDLQLQFRSMTKFGSHTDASGRHTSVSTLQPRSQTMSKLAAGPCPLPDTQTQIELEAAAYRRLVEHLRKRSDVQNIDLMNLAGFCRNCLANWYQEAANAKGLPLDKDGAREIVYGMPYKQWQAQHQTEANPDQKAAFAKSHKH